MLAILSMKKQLSSLEINVKYKETVSTKTTERKESIEWQSYHDINKKLCKYYENCKKCKNQIKTKIFYCFIDKYFQNCLIYILKMSNIWCYTVSNGKCSVFK